MSEPATAEDVQRFLDRMTHDAILRRHEDGTVTVEHADPVIWVSPELLEQADTWVRPSDRVLQLDTAGQYLYRRVGPAPDGRYLLYERVSGG